MATKEMIKQNFRTFKRVKEEYGDRQLTHTCPHCSKRYPNSSKLIQHMNEEHISFVRQTETRIVRAGDISEGERYHNTVATCPYCKQDFQTRKKFMMHLETAHKEDEEQQDEGPKVKVIRVDGPFVTPGATESKVVQNLLNAIGGTANRNTSNGSASKLDSAPPAKLQYKCFWCEASFRKRGKLMDHIDSLHKHDKTTEMAQKISQEDLSKSHGRQIATNHMSHLDVPKVHAILGGSQRSPQSMDSKPSTSSSPSCSFTLIGSLSRRFKPPSQPETTPTSICKFYLGKKDNPLANSKASQRESGASHADARRYSLPGIFDESNNSYNFPYGMLSANQMTAAMQRSLMMSMRPQLLNATQFYAPSRMPLLMPGSEYMLNHANPGLDPHSSQHAQLFARLSAMAQMSPLGTSRSKTPSESPLDLTKSFI